MYVFINKKYIYFFVHTQKNKIQFNSICYSVYWPNCNRKHMKIPQDFTVSASV